MISPPFFYRVFESSSSGDVEVVPFPYGRVEDAGTVQIYVLDPAAKAGEVSETIPPSNKAVKTCAKVLLILFDLLFAFRRCETPRRPPPSSSASPA